MLNNKILKLSQEDYQSVYEDIENYAQNIPNFVAIGKFGNVKNPSISDLDIFLCYADSDFINSRNNTIKYIRSQEIHNYLCSHDPLIIPQSLLGFINKLHTLYELNITLSNVSIKLNSHSAQYDKFLESVWSIFLLPILLAVITKKERYNDRFKLLLLKNIHQSISNYKGINDYLNLSEDIRNEYLKGSISTNEINHELYSSSLVFLKILSKIDFKLNNEPQLKSYYLKARNRYIPSNGIELSYKSNLGFTNIYLPNQLFKFADAIFYNSIDTSNSYLNEYIYSSNKVYDIVKRVGGPYPFVTPFNYPFFKKDFIFQSKKFISKLLP